VRVADVGDCVARGGVLAELHLVRVVMPS
jgi:hypothetical protein